MAKDKSAGEMSEDTKTLITVLLLLFAYPIGLVLMFIWTKWPKWLKIILTLPIFLAIFAIIMAVFIAAAVVTQNKNNPTNRYMNNMSREYSPMQKTIEDDSDYSR